MFMCFTFSSILGYWHWKLIKKPNLEHLKSPCSVNLMWWDNKPKYLGHDFQWGIFEIIPSLELSASLNNRLLSVRQKLILIAPGYYSRKYGTGEKTRTGDPRHVTIGQLILWDFPVDLRYIWNHFKVVSRFSVLTYLENKTMKLKTTNWLKNGKQQNEQLGLERGKLCIFFTIYSALL